MKIFFDSSALVSLLYPESAFHRQAVGHWTQSESRATSCHALAESYRTLTTLKHPLTPENARAALDDLRTRMELVHGTPALYSEAMKRMAKGQHAGAMIYDALHCVAAEHCHADKIVTRNKPHFDFFAGKIEVEALA
jgi:predicted nucleic acid-binding protein